MRKYIVELIGTFFLVLTIGLTVIGGAGAMAPIAIGAMLMVMIYAGGHISGAHYNPAVTLAVWLRGGCETKDVPAYLIAQLLGAAGASLIVNFLNVGVATSANIDMIPALIVEFLGAFALCYVVLQTATTKSTAGNSYYGLAIGFTVTACAYAFGGISGGAFNPAVALGISIMELSNWMNLWIFLAANFLGGFIAALTFRYVYEGE